jgi:hypothetical protein
MFFSVSAGELHYQRGIFEKSGKKMVWGLVRGSWVVTLHVYSAGKLPFIIEK